MRVLLPSAGWQATSEAKDTIEEIAKESAAQMVKADRWSWREEIWNLETIFGDCSEVWLRRLCSKATFPPSR